jgi:hypothetical protein
MKKIALSLDVQLSELSKVKVVLSHKTKDN